MSELTKTVRAVLFDMDGTVLDTEKIHKLSWERAMGESGVRYLPTTFFDLIGLNNESTRKYLSEHFGVSGELYQVIMNNAEEYSRQYYKENGIPIKQGFFALSDYLMGNSMPAVIVTGSNSWEAEENLSMCGILDRFSGIISGDKVELGKPDPEPYLKAAELSGFPPSECLAIEDSANGIISASRAGIRCVYVPDLLKVPEEILCHATYRADTLDKVIDIIKDIVPSTDKR